MSQFESFKASSLFCRKCDKPMAVREKLLLILPDREIHDYLCSGCGGSLGQRVVKAGEAQSSLFPARGSGFRGAAKRFFRGK